MEVHEHVASAGAGGFLLMAAHWAWKFLRRDRAETKAEGASSERMRNLENGQREVRQDLRDLREHVDSRMDRLGDKIDNLMARKGAGD
jgi:hypothetical protein